MTLVICLYSVVVVDCPVDKSRSVYAALRTFSVTLALHFGLNSGLGLKRLDVQYLQPPPGKLHYASLSDLLVCVFSDGDVAAENPSSSSEILPNFSLLAG